ncbi:hypothetical protein GCM10009831_09300 [Dietzia cercidiphylli]|uniref:Uncharacterized protein n=1 Tax=Dietzia cercidiphylli TaxID=498199 RepID=A0ABN2ID60_9ACTN
MPAGSHLQVSGLELPDGRELDLDARASAICWRPAGALRIAAVSAGPTVPTVDRGRTTS